MLFTNGFVLSRVELDTLVDLLLLDTTNASSSSGGSSSPGGKKKMVEMTEVELSERFSEIDTDNSGCKCCTLYVIGLCVHIMFMHSTE